jgi:hypothetical protein
MPQLDTGFALWKFSRIGFFCVSNFGIINFGNHMLCFLLLLEEMVLQIAARQNVCSSMSYHALVMYF